MVIINPSIATQPASYSRPAGPAPILPADRVLMAVVLGQKAGHLYELASGNLRLMAESQTALRQGEQLQLKVTGFDEAKRPQLEILSRLSTNLSGLIKASLPHQQNLNQLSAALLSGFKLASPPVARATEAFIGALPSREQLTDPGTLQKVLQNSGLFLESHLAKGEFVPTDLKTALLKLARQLENASPKGLIAQTNASGDQIQAGKLATAYGPGFTAGNGKTPLEGQRIPSPPAETASNAGAAGPSKIAAKAYQLTGAMPNTTAELPGDMRPQARILPQQTPLPANPDQLSRQLLSIAQGALARQEAHQLLHLQSSDPQQSQFLIELPIRDRDGIDVWQLHIERRQDERDNDAGSNARQDDAQHHWRITLNFDFPGLGPVKSTIQHSDSGLAVNFFAENATTASLIQTSQEELKQRLADQGIVDAVISSRRGNCDGPRSPLHQQHLLDDQA